MTTREIIERNLIRIRKRIEVAANSSGRRAEEIRLVAVTKSVGLDQIQSLIDLGVRDFGENRPQAIWERAEHFQSAEVRWHLIGHLQRNKAKRTVPWVSFVHSVDSARIAEELSRIGIETQRPIPALLEVNISGDATKTGLSENDAKEILESAESLTGIQFRGLMGMSSLAGNSADEKREFQHLRELRDAWQLSFGSKLSQNGGALVELSMGMSEDFEVAIEEGSTMVRIGSALFAD